MDNKKAIQVLKKIKALAEKCNADVVDDPEEILTDFSIDSEKNIQALGLAIEALEKQEKK